MTNNICPDCESEITERNPLIKEIYNPELHGSCQDCYDPTPAGPVYQYGYDWLGFSNNG